MNLKTKNELFATKFLEAYLALGFGNMPKREIDLLILRLLVECDEDLSWDNPPTAFMLAQQLGVKHGKLRSMMDELSYRRPAEVRDALARAMLRQTLIAQDVESAGNFVKIQVEDAYVREYAKSLVKDAGGIVDASFDRSIISLSADRYLVLAAEIAGESERKRLADALKNEISNKSDRTLTAEERRQEIRHEFLKAVAGQAGKELTSNMFKLGKLLLTGGTSEIVELAKSVWDACQVSG